MLNRQTASRHDEARVTTRYGHFDAARYELSLKRFQNSSFCRTQIKTSIARIRIRWHVERFIDSLYRNRDCSHLSQILQCRCEFLNVLEVFVHAGKPYVRNIIKLLKSFEHFVSKGFRSRLVFR